MRAIASALLLAALHLAAPAAAQSGLPDQPGQRRVAAEVLDQLLAADPDAYHMRDWRGHDLIGLHAGPRASRARGVCELDGLLIDRAPAGVDAAHGPPRIRGISAGTSYYVLTDAAGAPE